MSNEHDQEFNMGVVVGKIDLMLQKQDKLENWFIEHAKSDNTKFDEIHSSISGMKSKMYIVGAVALAMLEGGRHAVTSWFGGK